MSGHSDDYLRGDPQEEGTGDRLFHGIDGTMGDAMDVPHPFVGSVGGAWCSTCGLGCGGRAHIRYAAGERRYVEPRCGDHGNTRFRACCPQEAYR